jgi:hypothetical protein
MKWCTEGLVEIQVPRPSTGEAVSFKSFCPFWVPFTLPRINLSNLGDFLFAELFRGAVFRQLH